MADEMNSPAGDKLLLPYQDAWASDPAKVKVFEKSRRIGGTWGQAKEDVEDCIQGKYPDVWFSSADETAGKEYIRYCAMWARAYNVVAQELGIVLIDKERDIKALSIEFSSGVRINALSSNAKNFRSKGGKVILDEFAWHDDPKAMWAAAKPATMWGYPVRILSTHNGAGSLFNQFVQKIRQGKLNWSLHTVTIYDAVEQGLLDKIMGRPTTREEREAWIAQERADCIDEETWLQEYCCIPQDENSAFMPYDFIGTCEDESTLWTTGNRNITSILYNGFDIARKRHFSVIYLVEDVGGVLWTRKVIDMENTPFRLQRERLFEVLNYPGLRRCCIDETGIGMQLAEEAQEAFGLYRVEKVTFTGPAKEELAYSLKNRMEDRRFIIPKNETIRESFHSIRKLVTAAGNIRFDAASTAKTGHADHFWAATLANHAASALSGAPVSIITSGRLESAGMLRNY